MKSKFFGITNKNKFLNELLKVIKNIFIEKNDIGKANGVASLNDSGQIPSSQLPSYVDDVIEYDTIQDFPAEGESGKIYLALDTNISYRWSGSKYIDINEDKADKVKNAINGNFAALDSNGNLIDSGHKHSDYLTQHQDISGKEDKINKVTSLSSQSTDTQYPSAKCVYDVIGNIETLLSQI